MDRPHAAELAQRNAEHVPEFWLLVTEAQATELAGGFVCSSVKAMCQLLIDTEEEDRRRAERPIIEKRKRP